MENIDNLVRSEDMEVVEKQEHFINTKKASKILNMCEPKIQNLCRVHYKDFPGVLDGNLYKINPVSLANWSRKISEEGGRIPTLQELKQMPTYKGA